MSSEKKFKFVAFDEDDNFVCESTCSIDYKDNEEVILKLAKRLAQEWILIRRTQKTKE
jgi:hypothetical protein